MPPLCLNATGQLERCSPKLFPLHIWSLLGFDRDSRPTSSGARPSAPMARSSRSEAGRRPMGQYEPMTLRRGLPHAPSRPSASSPALCDVAVQQSAARCERGVSFGCDDVEELVWVRRGCGYSEGACVTGAEALVSMPRVNHGCCITCLPYYGGSTCLHHHRAGSQTGAVNESPQA